MLYAGKRETPQTKFSSSLFTEGGIEFGHFCDCPVLKKCVLLEVANGLSIVFLTLQPCNTATNSVRAAVVDHRLCPFSQFSSILSTHARPLLFSASAVCTRSLVRDDQVPESVRSVLGEAHRFFKEERVEAGVVIMDNTAPPEKVFFIGAGSVELQVGLCTTAPVVKLVVLPRWYEPTGVWYFDEEALRVSQTPR